MEMDYVNKVTVPRFVFYTAFCMVYLVLKSLISAEGRRFPRVHDIAQIIETCEENTINLPDYVEDFIVLSPYAVDFRYGIMDREFPDIEDLYNG